MNYSKNVISIDASTKGIGFAFFEDGELKESFGVHVEKFFSKNWNEKVYEIIEKFKDKIKGIDQSIFNKADTLVMNLGFQQTNGVDTNAIGLVMVQNIITYMFCVKRDYLYAPLLDITWLKELKRVSKFPGTLNELKKRKTKKYQTTMVASRIKFGKFSNFRLIQGEWFEVTNSQGEILTISDDEADAIFSGYAFTNLDIPKTTLMNRKEKNIVKKIGALDSEMNKFKRRNSTLFKNLINIKEEISEIKEKAKVKRTKTLENSLKIRSEKYKKLFKEYSENKIEIEKISKNKEKIKNENL